MNVFKQQKITTIVLIVFSIILISFLFLSKQVSVKSVVVESVSNSIKIDLDEKDTSESRDSNKKTNLTENKSVDVKNISVPTMWGSVEPTEIKKYPLPNPQELNYQYLELDRNFINALEINDEFPMYIPHTEREFIVRVDAIKPNERGNTAYIGSFVNFDVVYEIILTQGINSTYADLITPDGTFILQARGNDAWMYDTKDIKNQIK